jgi:hypothetical protein
MLIIPFLFGILYGTEATEERCCRVRDGLDGTPDSRFDGLLTFR